MLFYSFSNNRKFYIPNTPIFKIQASAKASHVFYMSFIFMRIIKKIFPYSRLTTNMYPHFEKKEQSQNIAY